MAVPGKRSDLRCRCAKQGKRKVEDLSEKEQIEQMRAWWSEYGAYVIGGLVLVIGALFGWNSWQSSHLESRVEASIAFEALADEVAEDRLEPAEAIAEEIFSEHPQTVYADQARLAMARLYMDQGRDQDAASALRALIDGGNSDEMKLVARLRLAKILLYQGRPEEVEPLLSGFDDTGFGARYREAVGDARYDMSDFEGAEAAYREALEADRATQLLDVALVQMKIADLPDASPDASPDPGSDAAVQADAPQEAESDDAADDDAAAPSGEVEPPDESEAAQDTDAGEPAEVDDVAPDSEDSSA